MEDSARPPEPPWSPWSPSPGLAVQPEKREDSPPGCRGSRETQPAVGSWLPVVISGPVSWSKPRHGQKRRREAARDIRVASRWTRAQLAPTPWGSLARAAPWERGAPGLVTTLDSGDLVMVTLVRKWTNKGRKLSDPEFPPLGTRGSAAGQTHHRRSPAKCHEHPVPWTPSLLSR